MKKLLTILTSISIITNGTFNIISCNAEQNENEEDDGNFQLNEHHSKLMSEIEENAVFTLLENGIDGDFLTTNNTALDAESLIQDEALKNDLAIKDLTVTDDIEKSLNEGDNEFNIDLVIGNKTSKLKTKIKNVKSGKLSKEELEDKVETFID